MSEEQHESVALPEDSRQSRLADGESQKPLPASCQTALSAAIHMDVGRQLFVDDYLIEEHDCRRVWHSPRLKRDPVLVPETELEMNGGECPSAAPFNGGVWYVPHEKQFRIYYQAGWFAGTAMAVSEDGLNWRRPALDVVPGTNLILPIRKDHYRDGCMVWYDHEHQGGDEAWKMFIYNRICKGWKVREEFGEGYVSSDGIHWRFIGRTTPCGDNSSFFRDELRQEWAFSVRRGWPIRKRHLVHGQDYASLLTWDEGDEVFWLECDANDPADADIDFSPQLYDATAVAYESIMLGALTVMYGPENEVCIEEGLPKTNDMQLCFSRDGLNWQRPHRRAFIACSREEGTWNRAYIHPAGGICCIQENELWFYYTAFSGISPGLQKSERGSYFSANPMYAGASTGLAILRRDGFAAMAADAEGGELMTRPVTFLGNRMFVNVQAQHGELRVAVLDRTGKPLPGLGADDCKPLRLDSTCAEVTWTSDQDMGSLAGQAVRFRFHLEAGELFAFWVTDDPGGASYGYMAAGGPGFAKGRDMPQSSEHS